MGKSTKYWFKRRRYGWGWFPVTWQGWGILSAWLVVVIGGAFTVQDVPQADLNREVGFYLLFVVIATVALITISYAKGPAPRWRWGKKPDDDPDTDY